MRLLPAWLQKKINLSDKPLLSFFSFALANFLISYFDLSVEAKLWIAFAGFGLPLALFFLHHRKKAVFEEPLWSKELLPDLSNWVWLLLGLLAILPRIYRLTELSVWPFTDEGYGAYFSIRLSQKWDWQFFFNFTQVPPFFNWLLAVYFKWFVPSLYSLWFFAAFVSILTVWACGFAARMYFPKSFSLFFMALVSFGFWPLYVGRICLPENIIFFWQVVDYFFLAVFLKHRGKSGDWIYSLILGVTTGFGFFVAVAWPVMALSISLLFLNDIPVPEKRSKTFYCFWFGLMSMFLLFAVVSFFERNGQYIRALWAFYPGMDIKRQAMDFLSCLRALFWGFSWRRLYGPVWGGLLNPISGALFFVGALKLARLRRPWFALWIFISFALFIFPAAAARGYDTSRILLAIPVVFLLGALGLQVLLVPIAPSRRILAVFLVLGLSVGLDFYHLFNRFHQLWGTPGNAWNFGKEFELWKSYEILEEVKKETGPGALLFNLRTHLDDVTPTLAAYSFDAASNPSISFRDSKWIAVLVDANYGPFLSKRFPEGRYYWLCPKAPYGRWMLGVIPVLPHNKAVLDKWFALDQKMREVTEKIVVSMPGASREAILDQIFKSRDYALGDPYLASVFWEKIFDNRVIERDAPGCLEAARQCVLEGYPLPEMYNEEGVILTQMGRYTQAREAFEKAVKADSMNLTPAQANLQAVIAAGK
jgi:tetratricopeptide (TPR) repeat protein